MPTLRKAIEYKQEALLLVYYLAMLIAGAAGFLRAPSPPVHVVLQNAHWVYSAGMVFFAITAIVSVFCGSRFGEVISLVVMAGLSFIHGVMIFVSTGPSGVQMAWRVIASGFGCFVIACQRRSVWIDRRELDRTLQVLTTVKDRS